jgi:hypothetical protein
LAESKHSEGRTAELDELLKRDPLLVAEMAYDEYRRRTLCGYCKNNAEIMKDATRAVRETEEKLTEMAMVKLKHPGLTKLPELNRTVHSVRDMAYREANEQPDRPAGPLAGMIGLRPFKPVRDDLKEIATSLLPRPRDLMAGRR